jgi:hypothetical protein
LKTWWQVECKYWGLPCETTKGDFWSMVGAIGTVLAALLTVLAVSIALWQSWQAMQDGKLKLKIKLHDDNNWDDLHEIPSIHVKATNHGTRPFIVSLVYMILPNKRPYYPFKDFELGRVEHGGVINYKVDLHSFLTFLEDQGYKSKKAKIKLVFEDSMQNQFKKSFKFNIGDWKDKLETKSQKLDEWLLNGRK